MRRTPIEKTCPGCKEKFITLVVKRKYCSKKCYLEFMRRARKATGRRYVNQDLMDDFARIDKDLEEEWGI